MSPEQLDNIINDPKTWFVTQFNNRSGADMIFNDRQKGLVCEILMYFSANMEELNAKMYPIDDPIFVRPEKTEIHEIMRLILDSMKQI